MNRRGFLGFFGGATVAGPKLATGIAENFSGASTVHGWGGASMGGMNAVADDGSWKPARIRELKAIISGRNPEAERESKMNRLYAREAIERLRLDSLRSVSPGYKQQMLTRGSDERQQSIMAENAVWDLKRLLAGK